MFFNKKLFKTNIIFVPVNTGRVCLGHNDRSTESNDTSKHALNKNYHSYNNI